MTGFEPQVVLLDKRMVGAGDVQTRLDRVYDELSAFCKSEKLPLHMTALTRHLLSFSKDADYPCGNFGFVCIRIFFPYIYIYIRSILLGCVGHV